MTDPARPAEETPWLSEPEQRAWRTFIFGITSIMEALSDALESDPQIRLSLSEYEILVRLSEARGRRLRMSELADQVVHSRSRLTHTVSRMEKRGLIERIRCSADGRGREALLTDEGMDLLRRAAPVHVRSVREALLTPVGARDFLTLGRIIGKTLPDGVPGSPDGTTAA